MDSFDVQNVETIRIDEGQYLFYAGDEGDYAYLLQSGRLQVLRELDGREFPIAEIGPNELVGEIAVLGQQPRLASVKALAPSTLVPLSKEAIDHILESDVKMVKHFYRVLIRRLSELYEVIIQECESNRRNPVEELEAGEPPENTDEESTSPPDDPASQPPYIQNAREAGEETTVILPGGVPLRFCFIPAGEFTMGNPGSDQLLHQDEEPQHPVRITKPFWLAKYPLTQAQWAAVMSSTPSEYQCTDCPVERVSWYDGREFLKRLCRIVGRGFRLPTEAEWEYACRAGTIGRYYWGKDEDETQIGDYAWYSDNSSSVLEAAAAKHPNPVGQKLPNAWGLHDMLGNVWEWCVDRYGGYTRVAQTDPLGPYSGREQVIRGGCWSNIPILLRCAKRSKCNPENRQNTIGLRPARTIF